MIEVCDCNIWYKKNQRRFGFKRFAVFFVLSVCIVGVYMYYKFVVTEQVLKICSDYSEVYATESVNEAVIETLKEGIKYTDLVAVEKNSNGDVTLMTANSYKINLINREISDLSLKTIRKKLEKGVPVPAWSFTGIGFLSGYGKAVYFKAVFVSNVTCEFSSVFQSVGINQTLHSIYIDVETEINLEIPANKKSDKCKSSVLVSEAIIVGKVPEIYLDGKLFG